MAFLCTCANLITKLGSLSHNLEERCLSIFRIAKSSSRICDMVERWQVFIILREEKVRSTVAVLVPNVIAIMTAIFKVGNG